MSAATLLFPFPKGAAGVQPASGWSQDSGVDITAPANTPELAVGAGTIVQEGISGFGPNAPILKLDRPIDGMGYAYYGHAGPDLVKVGQHVTAGQPITEVGAGIVGISTGPHLEFGLSPSQSIPAPGQTSGVTEQLLTSAPHVDGGGGGGGGIVDTVANALGYSYLKGPDPLGYSDAQKAERSVVTGAVGSVFSGFFDYVKGSLLKAVLYLSLIGGGVALAGYGLTHAVGRTQTATEE